MPEHARRAGIKYCGGCNPRYDRVDFVRRMQAAAGGRIRWTGFEDPACNLLVIVNGCERACIRPADFRRDGLEILTVGCCGPSPEQMIRRILSAIPGP